MATTQQVHTENLVKLDRSGADDLSYAKNMDDLASYVDGNGGFCDETTFLRSYFAHLQRRSSGYAGRSSIEADPYVRFARKFQFKEGQAIARIATDEHPDVPRVKINSFGIVIGTGFAESPVVRYSVEECRDVSEGRETETFYLGRIAVGVLWLPDTSSARRREDVDEGSYEIMTIAELERSQGELDVDLTDEGAELSEETVLIGYKRIAVAIDQYAKTSKQLLASSQGVLRSAAIDLGLLPRTS